MIRTIIHQTTRVFLGMYRPLRDTTIWLTLFFLTGMQVLILGQLDHNGLLSGSSQDLLAIGQAYSLIMLLVAIGLGFTWVYYTYHAVIRPYFLSPRE